MGTPGTAAARRPAASGAGSHTPTIRTWSWSAAKRARRSPMMPKPTMPRPIRSAIFPILPRCAAPVSPPARPRSILRQRRSDAPTSPATSASSSATSTIGSDQDPLTVTSAENAEGPAT